MINHEAEPKGKTMRKILLQASAMTSVCPASPFIFDGEPEINLDDPKVKAHIDKMVAEATNGLVNNRDSILAEKKDLQKQFEEISKKWEGYDAEKVAAIMQRIENDEEAKLIADGKYEEAFEKRTDALKADYNKRIQALSDKDEESQGTIKALNDKIITHIVESNVRQAALEAKVIPSAMVDVISRAKSTFSVDENDRLLVKDSDGSVRLGKDGKTPLKVAEWLEAMKEHAAHWFPPSSGAGAGGGRNSPFSDGDSSITISRSDARNAQKYQAAKQIAEKAGKPLQVVDDLAI